MCDYFETALGAAGRTLTLSNDATTYEQSPMASRSSVRQALSVLARAMRPEQDILFVYVTSHGSREGAFQLAQKHWRMANITPSDLRGWLDELPIKWKVIAVSACHAGHYFEPLADAHTMVMVAAKATERSFGCGDDDMTFFGKALFREAMPHSRRLSWGD